VKVDSKGKVGKPRPFKAKGSKWVRSLRQVDPARVLFLETFTDVSTSPWKTSGSPLRGGLWKAKEGKPDFPRSVGFSNYQKGIMDTKVGAMFRVRYRLSAPCSKFKLQMWSKAVNDVVFAFVKQPVWGEWCEIEVPLAKFKLSKSNQPFRQEVQVQDMTILGCKSEVAYELEVDEVLVYMPRREAE
jgi:hypothetical protein